jgi:hypothetical protein
MAWVALDRTVRDAERFKLQAPLERWRQLRDHLHATICERGFDRSRNTFTQSFGSSELDASLLLMPVVGFLPPDDPRVQGTVAAIEKELVVDGFVLRYRTRADIDGLPPGEGVFLPFSFWLANNYKLQKRDAEAFALFERLLSLRNDVGLLAEEYDPPACMSTSDPSIAPSEKPRYTNEALSDSAIGAVFSPATCISRDCCAGKKPHAASPQTTITFKWKDYRREGRDRYQVMTLATHEFIRRFLMHVLPAGFHRIRYYGLLASGHRAENIARARKLLTHGQYFRLMPSKQPATMPLNCKHQSIAAPAAAAAAHH